MDTKTILSQLEKFGLSENEAKVYITILSIPSPTVDLLAKGVKINRSSVYPIIDKLKSLGLISVVKKSNKSVYKATDPNILIDILKEKISGINYILPALLNLGTDQVNEFKITYYEGKEGLKTVLKMILKEAKEIYVFGDSDNFQKTLPGYAKEYIDQLIQKKKMRVILRATPLILKGITDLRNKGKKTNNVRVLPEGYGFNNSGFDIYGDKVIIYSFTDQPITIVMQSKIIANMMRTIFEIIWKEAEKYNNTIMKNI